jgi:transcriptional regulator with GAF, ATPase, and Fis domain
MNPRIVVMAGPLKGKTISLTEEETSIGRNVCNLIQIDTELVSRSHCLIKRQADEFVVRDLNSRNSTFVNEVPINERVLKHGDQIIVGESQLVFLLHEDEAETPGWLQFEEGDPVTASTIELRTDDSVYLQPERVQERLPESAKIARNLNALLKISSAINSVQDLKALEQRLMTLIFEVAPAEQGAVLLIGDNFEEFTSVLGWSKESGEDPRVCLSRTIVRHVLQQGKGILTNNILRDRSLGKAHSVVSSQIRSVLCVPLQVVDKRLGAIYLVTRDPAPQFDEDHLELVTAIAAIAAVTFQNVRHLEWLKSENESLRVVTELRHEMVGESSPMCQLKQRIAKVAPTDATVLILGESGAGKELVARAIHQNSPRAHKRFEPINCAAVPDTLWEETLFGHEPGRFTGATKRTEGRLKAADGGTIFLDEIGEIPLAIQAKLLRVIEDRKFERVGGGEFVTSNVRWIAATNRDLAKAVGERTFRDDLYFRLNVITLKVPPLRERQEDIPLLATYFADRYSKECKRASVKISPEARARLIHHDWPGNIRELQNAIQHAVVLGRDNVIWPEDLPENVFTKEPPPDAVPRTLRDSLRECRRQIVRYYYDKADGNRVELAKLLGIAYPNVFRELKDVDLSKKSTGCPLLKR